MRPAIHSGRLPCPLTICGNALRRGDGACNGHSSVRGSYEADGVHSIAPLRRSEQRRTVRVDLH